MLAVRTEDLRGALVMCIGSYFSHQALRAAEKIGSLTLGVGLGAYYTPHKPCRTLKEP